MLGPDEVPSDGMCRVIVDERGNLPELNLNELSAAMVAESTPSYPQLVGLSLARLCGANGSLWCIGEVDRVFAEVLMDLLPVKPTRIRSGVLTDLLVYRLGCDVIERTTVWPPYAGDYGLHVFGLEATDTTLQSRFVEIEMLMVQAAELAPSRWRQLIGPLQKRTQLGALVSGMQACILPDGPSCTHAAFHSSRLSATDICSAIGSVCDESGLRYRIVENRTEEYRLL